MDDEALSALFVAFSKCQDPDSILVTPATALISAERRKAGLTRTTRSATDPDILSSVSEQPHVADGARCVIAGSVPVRNIFRRQSAVLGHPPHRSRATPRWATTARTRHPVPLKSPYRISRMRVWSRLVSFRQT
jgi:hypothetical protein